MGIDISPQWDGGIVYSISLVKILAGWFSMFINGVAMSPLNILSRIKQQSISMCLVLSWNTMLEAICRAADYHKTVKQEQVLGSLSLEENVIAKLAHQLYEPQFYNLRLHLIVQLYYDIILFTLPCQEISSQKGTISHRDLHIQGDSCQSASVKPSTLRRPFSLNNMPHPGVLFRYQTIQIQASQYLSKKKKKTNRSIPM